MKKVAVVIAVVATLSFLAGYRHWRIRSAADDVTQKVFGGKQVLETFDSSQTATAQRLHYREKDRGSYEKLSSYDKSDPVQLTPSQLKELQDLFKRHASYDWGAYSKGCIVDYGVIITFRSTKGVTRIALCFSCNWLGIFNSEDDSAAEINSELDFDPARKQLVAIVKEIYPGDEEIQALR